MAFPVDHSPTSEDDSINAALQYIPGLGCPMTSMGTLMTTPMNGTPATNNSPAGTPVPTTPLTSNWVMGNGPIPFAPSDPVYGMAEAIRGLRDAQTQIMNSVTQQAASIAALAKGQADLRTEINELKEKGRGGKPSDEEIEPGEIKEKAVRSPPKVDATMRALQASFRLLSEAQGGQKAMLKQLKADFDAFVKKVEETGGPGANGAPAANGKSAPTQPSSSATRRSGSSWGPPLPQGFSMADSSGSVPSAPAGAEARTAKPVLDLTEMAALFADVLKKDGKISREQTAEMMAMMLSNQYMRMNIEALWDVLDRAETRHHGTLNGINVKSVKEKVYVEGNAHRYWRGQLHTAIQTSGDSFRQANHAIAALVRQREDWENGDRTNTAHHQFVPKTHDGFNTLKDTMKFVQSFCKTADKRGELLQKLFGNNAMIVRPANPAQKRRRHDTPAEDSDVKMDDAPGPRPAFPKNSSNNSSIYGGNGVPKRPATSFSMRSAQSSTNNQQQQQSRSMTSFRSTSAMVGALVGAELAAAQKSRIPEGPRADGNRGSKIFRSYRDWDLPAERGVQSSSHWEAGWEIGRERGGNGRA